MSATLPTYLAAQAQAQASPAGIDIGDTFKQTLPGTIPLGVAAATGTTDQLFAGVSTLTTALTSAGFWKRILVGWAGVGLISVGVVIMLASSKTVRNATDAAIDIAL